MDGVPWYLSHFLKQKAKLLCCDMLLRYAKCYVLPNNYNLTQQKIILYSIIRKGQIILGRSFKKQKAELLGVSSCCYGTQSATQQLQSRTAANYTVSW